MFKSVFILSMLISAMAFARPLPKNRGWQADVIAPFRR